MCVKNYNCSLETESPTRSQPQPSIDDGWRKVNLTVPNDKPAAENVRPIVPPRRKRSSTNQTVSQRCGFKELFGSFESPRSSCNSLSKCTVNRTTEKETPETFQIRRLSKSKSDINISERKSSCYSNTAETLRVPLARPLSLIVQGEYKQRSGLSLKRNVSRVGNKKSDKFFGENISDCLSDEPLTPDPDNIPENILAAYSTEISKSILNSSNANELISDRANDDDSSLELDRKRNLDKKAEFLMAMLDNDDEQDDGGIIIKVPPRKSSQREVENHCEPIIPNEHTTVEQNAIKRTVPGEEPNVAPRKFPRAKDVSENPNLEKLVHNDVKAETHVIEEKKANSANPLAKVEIFDNQPDKAVEVKPVKRVRHLSQENLMSKKIISTKSKDMIDLLQMEAMTKSQHENSRDNHILKKYNSQQSFLTNDLMCQIADRVYGFRDPFEIDDHIYDDGSSKCLPNSKLATRKISLHRKESVVTRIDENAEENQIFESPTIITETETHIIAKNGPESMEESKSVMLKCVDFIKAERTIDMGKKPFPSINENILLSQNQIKTESIASLAEIDDSIQLDVPIASENDESTQSIPLADSESSIMLLHTNESKDSINGDEKSLKHNIAKRLLEQTSDGNEIGKRRDSIDELNQWFRKHKDLSDVPRRGSVDCVGYDTKRVFPFGKSDAGAGSNFFENKTLSKSLGNIFKGPTDKVDTPGDHSILLKYLKQNE